MELRVNIHRNKGYVGALMPYRVMYNGREVCKLSNGETKSIMVPAVPGTLEFSMVGNSMAIHKIKGSLTIDPSKAQTGVMDIELTTVTNWKGILLSGLIWPTAHVKLVYQYR